MDGGLLVMIVETLIHAQFEANKTARMEELRKDIIQATFQTIRGTFDKTRLDSTAHACIAIAREMGYADLAEEMENDLITELTQRHDA